jgi:hypothetical protein
MVHNTQNYQVLGLCLSSGILKRLENITLRKLDLFPKRLCSLTFRILDDGQSPKPSNSEFVLRISEPKYINSQPLKFLTPLLIFNLTNILADIVLIWAIAVLYILILFCNCELVKNLRYFVKRRAIYCYTRPESHNNLLPVNGSLTHISVISRINHLLGNGSVITAWKLEQWSQTRKYPFL